jgi:hypothetical protein
MEDALIRRGRHRVTIANATNAHTLLEIKGGDNGLILKRHIGEAHGAGSGLCFRLGLFSAQVAAHQSPVQGHPTGMQHLQLEAPPT